MVFCGKPSGGCNLCRSRKIKCDEAKPACSQCLKGRRICPGYRDLQTLMFRDESERVIRKAKIRNISTSLGKESQMSSPESIEPSDKSPSTALLPLNTKPLSVSVDEQALCFFFSNYVLADAQGHPGYLNHLPSMTINGSSGGALSAALTSVSLAGLANVKSAPVIMANARTQYTSALRLINNALQDPIQVKTDATLTAVILLSIFETVTCSSPRSMKSWSNHIEGATALLKMRGLKQFEGEAGSWMFVYLRNQIVTSCLQRNVPVCPTLVKWTREGAFRSGLSTPGNKLAGIVIDFCDVRAKIASGDIQDPVLYFSMLSGIEIKLADWASALPDEWTYSKINISQPSDEVCDDSYFSYRSIWTANGWNNYRCVRILANELLLGHLSHHSEDPSSPFSTKDYDLQRRYIQESMDQLAADICASVPYYLNYHILHSQDSTSQAPAATGLYCLWPLYLVGGMVGASPHRRRWVIARLRYIGNVMGIQQANAFANRLQEAEQWRSDNPNTQEEEDKSEDYWPLKVEDDDDNDVNEDDILYEQEDEDGAPGESWRKYIGRPGRYAIIK